MIDQGARLVDMALDNGSAFKLDGWKYVSEAFPGHTLHFIGLLSDGGVHSRYDQLVGFVQGAAKDGAKRIRVHILTVSVLRSIDMLQTCCAALATILSVNLLQVAHAGALTDLHPGDALKH